MKTVYRYQDGSQLKGVPSDKLIAESENESSGTGAVLAYLDTNTGVWRYVAPGRVDSIRRYRGADAITVYVK